MASSQLPGAPSNLSIGGLLAIKQIDTIALANTTSTSLVDIDATTAAITVTVPTNGKVLIKANPYGWMSGASNHGAIGLREGGADVAGTTIYCFYNTNTQISLSRASYEVLLTGLTPGTTHTYKLAMRVAATGTLNLGISATEGPSFMEAWAVDQVLAAPGVPWSYPRGYIGQAGGGVDGIVGSMIDVTGCTVTATVPANRLIRVDGMVNSFSANSGSGNTLQCQLVCDGVGIGYIGSQTNVAQNNGDSMYGMRVHSPTAGAHTWKMQTVRIAGSNTIRIYDATISVHDIGGQ